MSARLGRVLAWPTPQAWGTQKVGMSRRAAKVPHKDGGVARREGAQRAAHEGGTQGWCHGDEPVDDKKMAHRAKVARKAWRRLWRRRVGAAATTPATRCPTTTAAKCSQLRRAETGSNTNEGPKREEGEAGEEGEEGEGEDDEEPDDDHGVVRETPISVAVAEKAAAGVPDAGSCVVRPKHVTRYLNSI